MAILGEVPDGAFVLYSTANSLLLGIVPNLSFSSPTTVPNQYARYTNSFLEHYPEPVSVQNQTMRASSNLLFVAAVLPAALAGTSVNIQFNVLTVGHHVS